MADPDVPNAPAAGEPAAEPASGAPGADWEALGAGADGTKGAATERILNQDEIDSLLGFDVGENETQDKSGIRAIINSALVSYERLPMLEIVVDRVEIEVSAGGDRLLSPLARAKRLLQES